MRRPLTAIVAGAAALAVSIFVSLSAIESQSPSNTWAQTGNLRTARAGGAAVLLLDGQVLVTGGFGADASVVATSERFTVGSGEFTAAASMAVPRANHTATLLPDGRVLVVGGIDPAGAALASTEIFDPTTNAWTAAAPLHVARAGHSATALYDGRVVIAGGDDRGALSSVELFDPNQADGGFTLVEQTLSSPRTGHAAALLYDGRVLIAGGFDGATVLASVDVFDPFAQTVSPAASLTTARAGHSATTLLDGKVLIAGGAGASAELDSAEVYDPTSNAFAAAANGMIAARQRHQAILLPHNNQVLIVGGLAGGKAVARPEVYVAWAGQGGTFYQTNIPTASDGTPREPGTARVWSAASALSFNAGLTIRTGPNDGLAVLAGGSAGGDAKNTFASSELYRFATVTTDRADYPPNTSVEISGSGWLPGEQVTLTLVEVPARDVHTLQPVTADENGRIFTREFAPDQDDLGLRFFLTATGKQSQAQTSFSDSFKAHLEGQDKPVVSPPVWTTKSLANWTELDEIPTRIHIDPASQANGQVITINFDHTKNATPSTPGTPGIENLIAFNSSSNVKITAGPTLSAPAGIDTWSYTLTFDVMDNLEASIEFKTVLAAGAHNFTGNSLSLNAPSLGTLQISKPAASAGSPDLSVTKSGPSTAAVAGTINYSIDYKNLATGSNPATGTQITDMLPAALTLVQGSCVPACSVVGGQLTWNLGTVATGATGSVSFQAIVGTAVGAGATITNTATIASAQTDPVTSNNSSSTTLTVAASNNASIAGTIYNDADGNGAVTSGEPGLSGVTVTRSGASSGTTTTDANGAYSFTGLSTGTYTVTYTPPTGYANTGAATSIAGITVSSSGTSTSNNFFARRTTTTALTGPSSSTAGNQVTFTATVTSAAGNPNGQGTVSFKDGTTTICSNVALTGNTASCTVSTLTTAGSPHAITAEYTGSSAAPGFAGSTSTVLTHTVDAASSMVAITWANSVYDRTPNAASAVVKDSNGQPASGAFVTLTYYTGTVVAGTGSASAPVDAGTYTVEANFAGNSTFASSSSTKTITIAKAGVTVTASSPAPIVYGAAVPTITPGYSGFISPEDAGVLTSPATCSTTYTSGSSVGTYPTNCSGAAARNYDFNYVAGQVTVEKAALTITATSRMKIYGETATFAGSEFTTSALVSGDSVAAVSLTSTGAAGNAAVGSYNIVPSAATGTGLSNYTITYANGTLTVNPAALTVTANSRNKTYGQAVTFGGTEFTSSALVSGDTVTAVTLTSTGAAANAAVGNYDIVPSAATGTGLTNYTITYAKGTLTIDKASLTITASNRTKTYGQSVTFVGTEFTTSGLVNGDTVSAVTLASNGAGASATIGVYPINASAAVGAGLTNYTIAYAEGTLTVNTAPLSITANGGTKTYGQSIAFVGTEFMASGLVNGDKVSAVTLVSNGAPATAIVGQYPIVVSAAVGNGLSNYSIGYVNGTLMVMPAPLTVTAIGQSGVFSDPLPVPTGTIVGIVNGDAIAPVFTHTATSASPAGNYAIKAGVSGLPSVLSNYQVVLIDGLLALARESASIEYTGDTLRSTSSTQSTSTASFNLAAVITEQQDGWVGNKLSSTQLKFTVYKFSDSTMSTPVTTCTGSVSATSTSTGTASCPVTLGEDNYIVKSELMSNPYYFAQFESEAVTVVAPGTGVTTGGGWLTEPDLGTKSNFGFTVKYLKNGNIQGNGLYIYRKTVSANSVALSGGGFLPAGEYNWIIKSNAMAGLAMNCSTTTPKVCNATFTGKNNINAVNRQTGVAFSLGGNYNFQVDVKDASEPGSSPGSGPDSYGLRVWDSSTGNYYLVAPLAITGGNVQVRQ